MKGEDLDIQELGSLIIGGTITDVVPNWCSIDIVFSSKYYLEIIDDECIIHEKKIDVVDSDVFLRLLTSVGKTIVLVRYPDDALMELEFDDETKVKIPKRAYIAGVRS